MGIRDEKYRPDYNFIGPPIGWFGESSKIMGHVSLYGRLVNTTEYGEGLSHVNAIGERFVL